jgi:hypothetical protein
MTAVPLRDAARALGKSEATFAPLGAAGLPCGRSGRSRARQGLEAWLTCSAGVRLSALWAFRWRTWSDSSSTTTVPVTTV